MDVAVEQQRVFGDHAFQHSDRRDNRSDRDPGDVPLDSCGDVVAVVVDRVLERVATNQVPADVAVLIRLGIGAAARPQAEDYWREGVIPTVRYSPSAVTSPPAVTGELGFTTAAMTGCTQGDRVESQVPVRDDPDC